MSRSTKKFIRLQKAEIRAQFFDRKKQDELINELYARYLPKSSENPGESKREQKIVSGLKESKLIPKNKKKHEKPANKTKNKN